MKRLLLFLITVCAAGMVHAESYRFFYLTIKPHDIHDTSYGESFSDDASFQAAVNKGDIIVEQMISVQLDPNGVGVTDQTHSVNYPQGYDPQGRPREFAKRKVGITARIKKPRTAPLILRVNSPS